MIVEAATPGEGGIPVGLCPSLPVTVGVLGGEWVLLLDGPMPQPPAGEAWRAVPTDGAILLWQVDGDRCVQATAESAADEGRHEADGQPDLAITWRAA